MLSRAKVNYFHYEQNAGYIGNEGLKILKMSMAKVIYKPIFFFN